MLIALLTDFGLKDGFVGTVKGVIKSINPLVDIIDISHDINSFDILEGALILRASYRYFPKYTIFTVVVDPGVGSSRNAIIVKTENYVFVAPDNGILSLVLKEEKIEKIIKIENENFLLPRDNNTFHGRDIFAPVSANISKGVPLEEFGTPLKNIKKINFPEAEYKKNVIEGQIIKFDKFGNAITNIESISGFKEGYVSDNKIDGIVNSFLEGDEGKLYLIKGSFGYYELSTPLSSAKDMFNLKKGDKVIIKT
ncbi:SAM-dependent chlorinase/fluorinase [Hydrogenivirga sp. 128-5-R1-1]|uniref:SAM hydrolase/SAM-dependent halogenase family protein n=1 Tax=Hydrogenivirga sp. 128-5-R1-1 TaxID=392423 RepID=UPI00015F1336|nr:SAM-dependent chlorinase/fluorinase [Hydrogenivirga sp. 128-5-R1-1]EDP74097.1 hypothetical protein HG1285_05133 [Hydrogenivirga sp. 128-5-R1-1]